MAHDERLGAVLNRPIEGDWAYLWIDATYVKLRQREGGRIVSVAAMIALACDAEARREIVGRISAPRKPGRSGRASARAW